MLRTTGNPTAVEGKVRPVLESERSMRRVPKLVRERLDEHESVGESKINKRANNYRDQVRGIRVEIEPADKQKHNCQIAD